MLLSGFLFAAGSRTVTDSLSSGTAARLFQNTKAGQDMKGVPVRFSFCGWQPNRDGLPLIGDGCKTFPKYESRTGHERRSCPVFFLLTFSFLQKKKPVRLPQWNTFSALFSASSRDTAARRRGYYGFASYRKNLLEKYCAKSLRHFTEQNHEDRRAKRSEIVLGGTMSDVLHVLTGILPVKCVLLRKTHGQVTAVPASATGA